MTAVGQPGPADRTEDDLPNNRFDQSEVGPPSDVDARPDADDAPRSNDRAGLGDRTGLGDQAGFGERIRFEGRAELDGRSVTADELRALALTNYGHFTTMTVDALRVRGLRLHLDRLVRDCRTVFGVELDADRVRGLVRRVAAPDTSPATVRVTVFDPDLPLARPARPARPRILVTTRPVATGSVPPLRLRSTGYVRDLPEVKHTGLVGPLHQRRAAQLAGFDDALFLDAAGSVTEGATWNIGFVQDGRVVLPVGRCLPGVTMRILSEALSGCGIACDRRPVRLSDIGAGTAAFVTNAAVGVGAVQAIDGTVLVESPLIALLRRAYDDLPGEAL